MPLNMGLIWPRRCRAPETDDAHPRSADLVARAGVLVALGLVLVALVGPATAGASGPQPTAGPRPDPAPAPAASTDRAARTPGTPSPDPAPGATRTPVSRSRTSGPVRSTVLAPRPLARMTSSGSALISASAAHARAPKHADRARHTGRGPSARGPTNPAVTALGALVARKLGELRFPLSITPTAIRRDGTLLLLAAIALGVLTVAGLSLLRLLVRLQSEWDEGGT